LKPPRLDDCHFSVIRESPSSFSNVLAYYNTIRTYLQHEDELINSRLTWSLTVHGLLLTGFGLMFSKSTELFAEFTRTPTPSNPNMHGFEIGFLCLVQALVAGLGIIVGFSSRGAIRAAHLAIQHVARVAHAGSTLNLNPPQTELASAVAEGLGTARPRSMEGIVEGSRVSVDSSGQWPEIVWVMNNPTATTFEASFQYAHPENTKVRALGFGLLPKVIAGGARGEKTRWARTYYLGLPLAAAVLWIFLFSLSIFLGVVAAWPQLRHALLCLK